jgi:hypothetical protein
VFKVQFSGRGVIAIASAALLLLCTNTGAARTRAAPLSATSASDPVLIARLAALAPTVHRAEAQQVVRVAYTTGRELARRWKVVWPPGLQNLLVHFGTREGGLCYQFASELLVRLHDLNLQTLELHWGVSHAASDSEHNVVVVTARGQPFAHGILLDNWRDSGRLIWGKVANDSEYKWSAHNAAIAQELAKHGRATPKRAPAAGAARLRKIDPHPKRASSSASSSAVRETRSPARGR